MTDEWIHPKRRAGEVTGYGLVFMAVLVAAVLTAMMLWTIDFMDDVVNASPSITAAVG